MAHRRDIGPVPSLTSAALDTALVGIGALLAARGVDDAPIEETLVAGSRAGMDDGDLRVLSLVVTWLSTHAERVNADHLVRLATAERSGRVRAFWSAVGSWLGKDRRFARLRALWTGAPVDVLPVGGEFQIRRRGEDPRFADTALRVPANTLRDRPGDVLTPIELAARHRGYRARVIMGPSYRADMWAALEADPSLRAAELARRVGGSYATAWEVLRDWDVARNAWRQLGRDNRKHPLGIEDGP